MEKDYDNSKPEVAKRLEEEALEHYEFFKKHPSLKEFAEQLISAVNGKPTSLLDHLKTPECRKHFDEVEKWIENEFSPSSKSRIGLAYDMVLEKLEDTKLKTH